MIMEPRDAAFVFLEFYCFSFACMQARMANLYNLHCIYRLHNLNIQLALLEYERQIRQRIPRRRYNPMPLAFAKTNWKTDRGSRYTSGIEQLLPTTSKASYE